MTRAALLLLLFTAACGSEEEAAKPASGGSGSGGTSGSGGSAGSGGGAGAGASAGDAGVVPAGSRVLAMEVNPPNPADHASKLDVAMGIGVRGIPPTLSWSVLEPTPNKPETTWVSAMNSVYVSRKVDVMLTIPTIDTVSVLVPSDLTQALELGPGAGGLAWDDTYVKARFENLLNAVLDAADPNLSLKYLLVGNEVNVYLAAKPDSVWQAYRGFIEAAKTVIQTKRPKAQVGVNVSFNGPKGLDAKIAALNTNVDVCFVSYYLNGNDFGGMQKNDVATDVDGMLKLCGEKPVVLKEFGYPTGVSTGSLQGQAQFVGQLFQAWDAHASRIPFVVLSRMYDGKLEECQTEAVAYGIKPGDPAYGEFVQFLCTLGFRGYDDTPKPAWKRIETEAKARGF
ncbi:MAG: hypothetical protein IT377_10405 [Polyangiaceae bacterium]|nr:hypothetical protein [Polyangiaceae bacterium]